MRAMESLAIPFEQPAHSDCAIHRGKPAYANGINRLNPPQVEMQGKEQIKKLSKSRKNRERDFVWRRNQQKLCTMQSFCRHDHNACCKTPLLPIQAVHDIFTPLCAHFRVRLTSSGVDKNTGHMTAMTET